MPRHDAPAERESTGHPSVSAVRHAKQGALVPHGGGRDRHRRLEGRRPGSVDSASRAPPCGARRPRAWHPRRPSCRRSGREAPRSSRSPTNRRREVRSRPAAVARIAPATRVAACAAAPRTPPADSPSRVPRPRRRPSRSRPGGEVVEDLEERLAIAACPRAGCRRPRVVRRAWRSSRRARRPAGVVEREAADDDEVGVVDAARAVSKWMPRRLAASLNSSGLAVGAIRDCA